MTLEKFKAPASTRIVSFNTSETDFVLLEEVSIDEMRQVIAEFEKKRIDAYWEESVLQPSKQGEGLRAFDDVGDGRTGRFFNAAFLKELSGTDLRGGALVSYFQNLTIEKQRELVIGSKPESRQELKGMTTRWNPVIGPNFYKMLDTAGSVAEFIAGLVNCLRVNDAPFLHPYRYFELLTLMWEKGLGVFPFDVVDWATPVKWTTLADARYGGDKSRLIRTIFSLTDKTNSDPSWTYSCTFFACTSIKNFDDISPALVERFYSLEDSRLEARYPVDSERPKTYYSIRGKLRSVKINLLRQFNHRFPEHAVALKRPLKAGVKADALRGDGKFNWLSKAKPELHAWSKAIREYVDSLTTKRRSTQINQLNKLGDYLCTLENPPLSPLGFTRNVHVYDATRVNGSTLLEYLKQKLEDPKNRTSTISTIRSFFDHWRGEQEATGHEWAKEFENPLVESDNGGKRKDGQWKTPRDSLPPFIINELKALLLEDDFAFSKTIANSLVKVIDRHTGESVQVHFHGLAVCLYVMLDLPIRSHQARWLDSGAFDEFVYDPATNTRLPNPDPRAMPRRNESVLRLERDGLKADGWLSAWINTNKTAVYESSRIGYSIPFVSTQLAQLLHMSMEWQRRYLTPLHAPIPYDEFQADTRERERPANVATQTIAPLFRDPTADDQRLPISYPRLKRFYIAALAEAQKRIEKKYGQKLKLVKDDGKGGLTWTVDLHSLRVSGITNLIEAGVPPEVVAQFVAGHATIVMVLHYLKYSPAKMRQILAGAHEEMSDDTDFVGSELFAESLEDFSSFMLGSEGAGQGAGYRAFKDKTGIMVINADGACPGMSCSTGGPCESETHQKYGAVPGGQRCGLCRYWLTGPAHLLGQVASVNNLAYAIRKKGMEIAALEDERIDAEDAGKAKRARELRDKVDLLRRELEIDINEWVARYKYAEKSMALMDDYLAAKAKVLGTDKTVPVPILTAGSAAELKVTLEQSHEFVLLDQITQLSEFTTGFKNREAELEKNAILSKMMVANGLKPFLLNLSDQQAHEAGNLMSALVLQQVRSQDLDDVLSGQKPLSQYPRLDATLKVLEEGTTAQALAGPKWASRLAELLSVDFDGNARALEVASEESF